MITETVHDPVCHMDIDPNKAVATTDYGDDRYYFCARGCKLEFDEDPEGVLKAEAEYDHNQPNVHMMQMLDEDPKAGNKKPWWKPW